MLLRSDYVIQLQRKIAPDFCCHSPNGIDQMQKHCCHYSYEISQHTLAPKAIIQKFPSLRMFHWLLRIPDFQPKQYR